jgi:hypothetical protein
MFLHALKFISGKCQEIRRLSDVHGEHLPADVSIPESRRAGLFLNQPNLHP